ncbi:hypothetical protein BN2127_JRS9_04005 [Bacillus subtilis]|nr:hypothetical protein BN2127_JRS2_03977 [Bacillus subtilis]CUB49499.1 hypothetical protein BN2127_JRS11_02942 [Bacillus subtilis]CUB59369.1 hypothetical protein BN2127_JRS9_04005 [Bacillus subtilis]
MIFKVIVVAGNDKMALYTSDRIKLVFLIDMV